MTLLLQLDIADLRVLIRIIFPTNVTSIIVTILIRTITFISNSNESDERNQGDASYVLDGTVLGFLPIYGNGSMWLEVAAIIIINIINIMIVFVIFIINTINIIIVFVIIIINIITIPIYGNGSMWLEVAAIIVFIIISSLLRFEV